MKLCSSQLLLPIFIIFSLLPLSYVVPGDKQPGAYLFVIIALCCCARRKTIYEDRTENKQIFFKDSWYEFNTELLRSAEKIEMGNTGESYKLALNASTALVMKVLMVDVTEVEFKRRIEMIKAVEKHKNVATLLDYDYSANEMRLLYDHNVDGSIMSLLHGTRSRFPWEDRLKIAHGTAKGISHIHSTAGPTFSLGNIKSSNILIDRDKEARITDIGLIPYFYSTGYEAPEVHTQASDIYSFGILLLEMLTGKDAYKTRSRDEKVNLAVWVESFDEKDWETEVLDGGLIGSGNCKTKTEMNRMLKIALKCVKKVPAMRPSMSKVVEAIEKIEQSSD